MRALSGCFFMSSAVSGLKYSRAISSSGYSFIISPIIIFSIFFSCRVSADLEPRADAAAFIMFSTSCSFVLIRVSMAGEINTLNTSHTTSKDITILNPEITPIKLMSNVNSTPLSA